jgi:hypothetical protein
LPAPPKLAPWAKGVFGNVRYVEEAGDLLGYELRLFQRDGRAMVELVDCEGWCNASMTVPLTRHGNGFELIYRDAGERDDSTRTLLRLTWAGRCLKLALWKNGQSLPLLKEDVLLHPQTRTYGLVVAHAMEEAQRRKIDHTGVTKSARTEEKRDDPAGMDGPGRNE